MLSFEELFQRLLEYTRTPLKSKEELDILEHTANGLMRHHMLRLASPWDVAKLISSAIRCNLRTPNAVDLRELSFLGLVSCPAPACRTLANLLRARQFDFPLADLMDTIRRDVQASQMSCKSSDAVCVVLSLLNQWHRLELTRRGVVEWFHVEQSSLFVGRLLFGLSREGATSSASKNHLSDTFSTSWVSNLMTFALWDHARVQDAGLVVSFLTRMLSSEAEKSSLADFTLCGLRSAPVIQQWGHLRLAILHQCRMELRNGSLQNQKVWVDAVKEELKGAFTQEPPFLSEMFHHPPSLSAMQCTALRERLEQSKEYLADADHDDGGAFRALLMLSRACRSFVSHTGNHAYVEIADDDLRGVELLTALALHLGRTSAARELLAWTAASGRRSEHVRWQRRLQTWEECWEEIPTWPLLPPPTTHSMLWTEYIKEVSARLSVSIALDALVTSSDVLKLRMVCEGSLRLDCGWGKELLKDPLAAPFLVIALAKLAHGFLNVGDAPMARIYLTMLGACVAGCPTPEGVLLLLQVLGRLAGVLVGSPCLLVEPHAGMGVYQHWEGIQNALAGVLPVNPEITFRLHGTRWRCYQLGDAFRARRTFYQPILQREAKDAGRERAADSNPAGGSSFTVVWIRHGLPPDGAALTVERLRVERGGFPVDAPDASLEPCRPYSVQSRARLDASALDAISQRLHTLFGENREQLKRGAASASRRIEIGRCPGESLAWGFTMPPSPASSSLKPREEGEEPPPSLPSQTPPHRASLAEGVTNPAEESPLLKEAWWARRRQLDAELAGVVREVEDAFGVARFLLPGEPPRGLRRRLWPLSERIVARIAALRGPPASFTDPPPPGEVSRLTSRCVALLQGLPFIAGEGRNRAVWYARAHVGDPFEPASEPPCPACDRQLQRTAEGLLEILARLWEEETGEAKTKAKADERGVDAVVEGEGWFALHREALRDLCREVTREVFGWMYDYLVEYYGRESGGGRTTPFRPDGEADEGAHVNLLELPREHLYLVVENDLHHFPLEGMDVLRSQSCSRVPSLAYLRAFTLQGGITPPEDCYVMEGAHFYVDSTAVASLDKFEALFHAHPGWTVDYADSANLSGGLNTQPGVARGGSSAVLPTLLREGRSVYVYLGHRRGESALPRGELYDRFPSSHFPDVLLMGCSSARMIGNAWFENYGMPWAYLHAGARSFIGCLWDITNGEVDRLTRRFLRYSTSPTVGEGKGVLSVGEALSAAREACKLPFLSGVTTVMYGVNRPFSSGNQTG
ncbi:unnamed protein product [Phytomonas sp. EM1]|nr:unnamed protein product [Phytomonas sp. EM1]|eukprot:CCW64498.1 unnamed protein product [Phytomonas sp. isolate EM1]